MSIRCYTSTAVRASQYQGWGATGAVILATTATGGNGPGILYSGTSAADNDKELSFTMVTVPASGTFTPAEDGSFSFSGAADGLYSFSFERFENQVSVGQATSTISVGALAAGSGHINLWPTLDGRAVIRLGSGLGVTIPAGQMVWVN